MTKVGLDGKRMEMGMVVDKGLVWFMRMPMPLPIPVVG